jgi:Ca2+-binding EF-hand superfamily protein
MRTASAVTLACTIGLLLGSAAAAQTPAPAYDPRAAFAQADTNKDGYIDYEEFIARMTEVYYLHDTNRDGSLSVEEARATLTETGNLDDADTNGDGHLTLHEFLRARLQDFNDADTNNDGLLSLEEVLVVYEKGKP